MIRSNLDSMFLDFFAVRNTLFSVNRFYVYFGYKVIF